MPGKDSYDPQTAVAMLDLFCSVGAESFDVLWKDLQETKRAYHRAQALAKLRSAIPTILRTAAAARMNIIIRPRSLGVGFAQLDDLPARRAAELQGLAFLCVSTSPESHQAWLSISDGPREESASGDLASALRRAVGGDLSATGAVRIAGSRNYKVKYAPDFPLVTVTHASPGRSVTLADLRSAGLLADDFTPRSTAAPRMALRPRQTSRWPDYDRALAGAPATSDGDRQDRSRADYFWCMLAIQKFGRGIDETAEQLMIVSDRAREHGETYAMRTARAAARAVDQRVLAPPRR